MFHLFHLFQTRVETTVAKDQSLIVKMFCKENKNLKDELKSSSLSGVHSCDSETVMNYQRAKKMLVNLGS